MKTVKNTKMSAKSKIALLAVGAIGLGSVGTMAVLTDTATTEINITSADLALIVNEDVNGEFFVEMDTENMKPGDVRTGQITVTNDSSIPAVITADKGDLVNFQSTLKDGDKDFTSETFAVDQVKTLDVTVTLPEDVTETPADETLTLKFDSKQTTN